MALFGIQRNVGYAGIVASTMSETNMPVLDWVHLPEGVESESLWECLHDAEILSCKSDLMARTVTLEFKIAHLVEKGSDLTFLIHFEKVASTRSTIHIDWPGEFKIPMELPYAEKVLLNHEQYEMGREQSFGWEDFEESLSTDPLMVSGAQFVLSGGTSCFKVEGMLGWDKFDSQYCIVTIRCGMISASRSDGEAFSFHELKDLGRTYWEAFDNR